MGILSRLINLVRANLNAMLGRAEDPARMLEQTLLDMETAHRKAKDQVARAIADQKRMEKAEVEQAAEVTRWEERAVLAVEQGDDALAREALQRKAEHTRIHEQYARELESHTANVESLRTGLHELESKLEELRRKKHLLVSRQRRAEAQDSITRTLEGIRDAGAVETVQRIEQQIDDMAAMADARKALGEEGRRDELEQRFQALEPDEVENELLALKERVRITHKPEA